MTLTILSVCSFVLPLSLFLLTPLLVDLARDFGVTIAEAGSLVAYTSLPAMLAAVVIGPVTDHFGRRPLLLAGLAVLVGGSFGSAAASNYEMFALSRVLTGAGAAAIGASSIAAVADLFAYRERGRAFSYLVGTQTVSGIVGTPLLTLLAAAAGWRWSFVSVGAVAAASWLLLVVWYPRQRSDARPTEDTPKGWSRGLLRAYLPVVRSSPARAFGLSTLAIGVGNIGFTTYLGALLIEQYGATTGDLAPIFALGGVGLLIGSQIGGRWGDHIGHVPITVGSVIVAGAIMLLMTTMHTTVVVVTLLNFLQLIPMGMRFASGTTILSEAIPSARATMAALAQGLFNLGAIVGPILGGALIERVGYWSLGPFAFVALAASGLIIGLFVSEDRAAPTATD